MAAIGSGELDGYAVYIRDVELEGGYATVTVTVRFDVDDENRVGICAVSIEGDPEALTPEVLRGLPFSRIVAWANGRGRGVLEAGGEALLVENAPWPPGGRAPRLRMAGAHNTSWKPPGFYERVAESYKWLTANGVRSPAARIAEANDVNVTTAHRWIKEARAKRLLAPGRKGSAS